MKELLNDIEKGIEERNKLKKINIILLMFKEKVVKPILLKELIY